MSPWITPANLQDIIWHKLTVGELFSRESSRVRLGSIAFRGGIFMSQKRPPTWGNPDHRRKTQLPAPPIAQIEQQLFSLLNPGIFKTLSLAQGEK